MSNLSNLYKEEWRKVENVKTYPHYLRRVVFVESDEFVHKVMSADEKEASELVDSIYNGDAYILKTAISIELVEELKDKLELGLGYSYNIWNKLYIDPYYVMPLKKDGDGKREGELRLGLSYKF